MMGAKDSIERSLWNASRHASSKWKVVSLVSKLHKGLEILLKSLMKQR